MENAAGVSRCYEIVSSHGTYGNSYQRLLAFTTMQRRGPEVLVAAVIARYRSVEAQRRQRRLAARAAR